ncbi:TRAP transporter small permease subunit [Desulfatitalea alkaliphila]|uniref:TRAP transporter small permease n=1 Tax=Desulfatitalea alkaliphila TaxID=2929485 RepID=A0AA41UKU7_9BACT|nr:TRAP transporter small permease [Desulfatitalea alkaliphila]MCJ8500821.1 TRAP transporter small permease [Desulfatitalea alkaliphila]
MRRLLKWIINAIDWISGVGGFLTGVMMCLGVGLIMGEIVFRTFFNQTLYVAEEYAGYLMAMLTFCALAYTLRERGHIRMTFLHKVVVGRGRAYLDLACLTIGFCFCLVLIYFTFIFFWDSVVTGSRSMQISKTYLAIPQAFLPFGALLFALQFFSEMLKSFLVIKGDTEGIRIVAEATDQGR